MAPPQSSLSHRPSVATWLLTPCPLKPARSVQFYPSVGSWLMPVPPQEDDHPEEPPKIVKRRGSLGGAEGMRAHFRERVSIREIERRSASLQAAADAAAAISPQGSPAEVAAAMVAMMQEQEKSKTADGKAVSSKSLPHPDSPKAAEEGHTAKRAAEASAPVPAAFQEIDGAAPQEVASKRAAENGGGASLRDPRAPPQAHRRGAAEAYQRLSGNEESPSGGAVRHASDSQNNDGELPLLMRTACGEQRLALRDHYNTHEIAALSLVRHYLNDRSRGLDAEQVRGLLTEWSEEAASRADVRFVMVLAGIELDRPVVPERLMSALRSLYALKHLPPETGDCLTRRGMRDGASLSEPPAEAVRDMLQDLNGQLPVSLDEANFVRSVVAKFSRHNRRVDLQHWRLGIAAWYIHIERVGTALPTLARLVLQDLVHVADQVRQQGSAPPATDSSSGQPLLLPQQVDSDENSTPFRGLANASSTDIAIACVLLPVGLWSLFLLHFMIVPTDEHCEHNSLNVLLGWSGLMNIMCLVGILALYKKLQIGTELVVPVVTGACIVMNVLLTVIGIVFTSTSSAATCGTLTWGTARLAYVHLPLMVALLACCAPLITGLLALGASLATAYAADQELCASGEP